MDGQIIFTILVGSALACFSLVMVGYSFFRGHEHGGPPRDPAAVAEDGSVGLEDLLDSIDTLELEYQLGNVADDQYRYQLGSYRLQVAAAIKEQLDSGDAPPELVLEREILQVRTMAAGNWRPCPQCDAPLPASSDGVTSTGSCPHCNAILSPNGLGTHEPQTAEESPSAAQTQ